MIECFLLETSSILCFLLPFFLIIFQCGKYWNILENYFDLQIEMTYLIKYFVSKVWCTWISLESSNIKFHEDLNKTWNNFTTYWPCIWAFLLYTYMKGTSQTWYDSWLVRWLYLEGYLQSLPCIFPTPAIAHLNKLSVLLIIVGL